MESGPGAARDLFLGFDPATRPVLWRLILVIQSLLYWCFEAAAYGEGHFGRALTEAATFDHSFDESQLYEAFTKSHIYQQLDNALGKRPSDAAPIEDLELSARVASAFFMDPAAPVIERVQRIASESRSGTA